MQSPRIAMKSSPCSPQLEKTHAKQRPSTAKNKYQETQRLKDSGQKPLQYCKVISLQLIKINK